MQHGGGVRRQERRKVEAAFRVAEAVRCQRRGPGLLGLDRFWQPEDQLVIGLVLATLAGLLAGVLPARRAARLDVLEAVHHE